MVNITDVKQILQLSIDAEIKVFLDGGWGVDALLGYPSRVQNDIDIFVEKKDYQNFIEMMKANAEQNSYGTRTQRAVDHTDWEQRTSKMDYSIIAAKHKYHEINRKQMKPVLQIDASGKVLARYEGVGEAARSLGVSQGQLCSCLKGRRKTCGGYQWKYA